MIRGVRAYDLTADLNPPVRSDPGLPLGGDAAHTPDRDIAGPAACPRLVPLHSGFDSLNLNLSWPELWDRRGPFWRGPFWL
jgi:hypothetical protein